MWVALPFAQSLQTERSRSSWQTSRRQVAKSLQCRSMRSPTTCPYAAKAAFEKAGAIDSELLVNGLEGISVDGPTGKVRVGKDHHVTLEMYTAKTEGAGLTIVEDLGQVAPVPGCS